MSKANYHPVSQLNGNLPNGSYVLPGNGYYSVEGKAPRLRFEHTSSINDDKYKYSQSYRIDPLDSLRKLKEEGSTLTRYWDHNPPVEQCRDRYIFVPKYVPREEPAFYAHAGLTQLQKLTNDKSEYKLNRVTHLPKTDYHVLPKQDLNDDIYSRYGANQPYDMMVLKDKERLDLKNVESIHSIPRSYTSSTTLIAAPK